ncbi:hypothetical protein B0H14DRAFT_2649557 [Mycena olivaceomarginata]|nr:hypothetical protein B0H14DRAFT_2649557 [Mycena olivaceomarginata]
MVGTGGKIKTRLIPYYYSEASHRLCRLLPTDMLLLHYVDNHPGFASARVNFSDPTAGQAVPPQTSTPLLTSQSGSLRSHLVYKQNPGLIISVLHQWDRLGYPFIQHHRQIRAQYSSLRRWYHSCIILVQFPGRNLTPFGRRILIPDSSLENLRIYGAAGYTSATTIPCTTFAPLGPHAPLTFSYGFPFTGAGNYYSTCEHLQILDVERIESITCHGFGLALASGANNHRWPAAAASELVTFGYITRMIASRSAGSPKI